MAEVIPSAIKNAIPSRRTIIFVYTDTVSLDITCSSSNQNKNVKKKRSNKLVHWPGTTYSLHSSQVFPM